MYLFNVIFLFAFTITSCCCALFHNPLAEIYKASKLCTKDASIPAECYSRCALETANMFSPSFDGINAKEFGYFYKNIADVCWKFLGIKVKPTCAQAEEFLNCFFKDSKTYDITAYKVCLEQFPLKNIKSLTLTREELAKNNNLACYSACLADALHIFRDDGRIDVNCINPHIDFQFKVAEVVAKCEEDNKQTNKCERNANRYVCLNLAFESAQSEYLREIRKSAQTNK